MAGVPSALVAALAVPVLLGALWWSRRRRRKVAVRYSSVATIRAALPTRSRWRRRIPAALLLAGLLALAAGVARPTRTVGVPVSSSTVVLAIDVSGSMCATDVDPNRLVAAQDAAKTFVRAQEGGLRIGIVAFAGFAALVVAPTDDQGELIDAIDAFTTSRGTAIGAAILTSIDAIAEINPEVAPTGVALGSDTTGGTGDPGGGAGPESSGTGSGTGAAGGTGTGAPGVDPDDLQPDTIVVLTDGANSRGVDPVTAAGEAAARHVPVYTVGFGTTNPTSVVCNPDQLGDDPMGGSGYWPAGGGGGPGGRALIADEATLMAVADATGGEYYKAEDAAQLVDVLLDLPVQVSTRTEQVEMTAWFVLLGALLTAGALGLSLTWNRV